MNNIDPNNPTLKAQFERALAEVVPTWQPVGLINSHLVGPFDNTDLIGLLTSYAPEPQPDLDGAYAGKHGQVQWQPARAFDGVMTGAVDLGASMPKEPHSVIYYYAEVEATEATLVQLSLACSGLASAWFNGVAVLQPTIPEPADPQRDAAWVELKAGKNTLLVKAAFSAGLDQRLGCWVKAAGQTAQVTQGVEQLVRTSKQPAIRLLARMTLAEMLGVAGSADACRQVLGEVREDAYATRWEAAWADAIEGQYEKSGHFAPFHDSAVSYQPVTQVQPYPEFWPQSSRPARELLVVDVSNASPQVEFALAVLQGLVNRAQPRLYLLHSRYARQDRQWLDELHFEGFTSQEITIDDAWRLFKGEIQGAVIYDGSIMDEIGAFHSDQLNQTNVLMMIGALNSAVPLTPELNAGLGLAVLFDARGKWANQYDMMRWAFVELFPHMNPRILATNYPGIFLITDYLVAFKIFTFWFPEYRTPLEENLLRGILAATPPNSPILGWWFDWMPNVKDAKFAHADAVMEWPGLLRGSYFGKILTPSHEATNLSVHSGVPVGAWHHKSPDRPAYDPSKVYYTFMISDGDNMGEALMMRTRDLQWDKPERGAFPMGWSFAPATSHLAPPVLNYYLRAAAPNDLLMGGLGVGYTESMIYLRAYPGQREQLWAQYARATDQAMGWIDTTCLWLIDGRHEEADRYARGSSGRLRGIFIGYGGSPDIAEARITHNNVVAFYSASRFMTGKSREEQVQAIVDDICAATRSRPDFIEAWVLNWGLEMSMLQQVQERLGPDYVCVRPDVLVEMRLHAAGRGKERD
ncbi:MAG: hypothetical protein M1546_19695 [Chloroflexi bacterium]|nr:hypothetical protein [Chloroflexota bacterium]